jgi:hypothetical protein
MLSHRTIGYILGKLVPTTLLEHYYDFPNYYNPHCGHEDTFINAYWKTFDALPREVDQLPSARKVIRGMEADGLGRFCTTIQEVPVL